MCEENKMWVGIDAFSFKKGDIEKINFYGPSVVRKRIKSANETAVMTLRIGGITTTSKEREEGHQP